MRNSKYHFKFEDLTVYTKAMEFEEVVNDIIKENDEENRISERIK